jgi:hypothetical protein
MARRELKLENLIHMDGGRIAVAFDQALARLAKDLDDRPGDDRDRLITLQMKLKPSMDEASGQYEDAKVQVFITEKIPDRKSKVIDLQPVRGGKLAFNDLSEDDARQHTIDEITGE